ncbi:MAG: 50S ribosomal protein L10 [Patescibacteria group bacterium]|nr:50S ribosomal protein L10 [Patescibacteria group bacterium]
MVNQAKIFAVDDFSEKLKSAKSAALIDYQGLSGEQLAKLRKKVKEAGGVIEVIKNTLISRGLTKAGIYSDQPLTGPTAVVFANEDEIEPLKIIRQSAQVLQKPEFKFGIYNGQILSLEKLQKFVDLPGKETLLARFVGGLANPLSRLVYGLNFNQIKLALTLKEIGNRKQELGK